MPTSDPKKKPRTTVADLLAEPLFEMSAENLARFLVSNIENARIESGKDGAITQVGIVRADSITGAKDVLRPWYIDKRWQGEELGEQCRSIALDAWEYAKSDVGTFDLPQSYELVTIQANGIPNGSKRFQMNPPASKTMQGNEPSTWQGLAHAAMRHTELSVRMGHERETELWDRLIHENDRMRNELTVLHAKFFEQSMQINNMVDQKWRRELDEKAAERDGTHAEKFLELLTGTVVPMLKEKYGAQSKLTKFVESIDADQAKALGVFRADQFKMLEEISPELPAILMGKITS